MNRGTAVLRRLAVALVVVAAGCDDGPNAERLAKMAEHSTKEQAEQNKRVTKAHASLTEGSKQLVEADANARRDLVRLQDNLRQDQADIGLQRNSLETERKAIALERRQDSQTSSSLITLGILLACLAPLVLAGITLALLSRSSTQAEVGEVLIEELGWALGQDAPEAPDRLPGHRPDSGRLPSPDERR
jgi:hypothetical protein